MNLGNKSADIGGQGNSCTRNQKEKKIRNKKEKENIKKLNSQLKF